MTHDPSFSRLHHLKKKTERVRRGNNNNNTRQNSVCVCVVVFIITVMSSSRPFLSQHSSSSSFAYEPATEQQQQQQQQQQPRTNEALAAAPPVRYITNDLCVAALPLRRSHHDKKDVTEQRLAQLSYFLQHQRQVREPPSSSFVLVNLANDKAANHDASLNNNNNDPEQSSSSSSSSSSMDPRVRTLLHDQIVTLPWEAVGAPASVLPTLGCLQRLCHVVQALLHHYTTTTRKQHGRVVIILACENGQTKTGVAVAAVLHYLHAVPSCRDGFLHFWWQTKNAHHYHNNDDNAVATAWHIYHALPPSVRTLWRNFEQCLDHPWLLQPSSSSSLSSSLLLRAVTLQGIPVEDQPRIDIYDTTGRRVYSSSYHHHDHHDHDNQDRTHHHQNLSHPYAAAHNDTETDTVVPYGCRTDPPCLFLLTTTQKQTRWIRSAPIRNRHQLKHYHHMNNKLNHHNNNPLWTLRGSTTKAFIVSIHGLPVTFVSFVDLVVPTPPTTTTTLPLYSFVTPTPRPSCRRVRWNAPSTPLISCPGTVPFWIPTIFYSPWCGKPRATIPCNHPCHKRQQQQQPQVCVRVTRPWNEAVVY